MARNSQPSQTSRPTTDAGQPGALRRLLINASMLIGGRTANAVMEFGTLAITARLLGIESFGALALTTTLAAIGRQSLNLKLGQAIITYGGPLIENGHTESFRQLISLSTLLEMLTTAVALMLSVCAILIFGTVFGLPKSELTFCAIYMSVIPFQMTGRLPTGILRLFNRFDRLAIFDTLQSAARLTGAVTLFVVNSGSLTSFLILWFISTAGRGILTTLAAASELRERSLCPHSSQIKFPLSWFPQGLPRFAALSNVNSILALTSTKLPTLLIGSLFGPGQAGLFFLADRIARAVVKPINALRPAVAPEVSQLMARNDYKRLRRLLLRSTVIASAGALLIFGALLILGQQLLWLMGGRDAVPAYSLLILLSAGAVINKVAFSLGPILKAAQRMGQVVGAQATTTVAYVAAIGILIPHLGLEGAGLATIAAAVARVIYLLAATLPLLRSE